MDATAVKSIGEWKKKVKNKRKKKKRPKQNGHYASIRSDTTDSVKTTDREKVHSGTVTSRTARTRKIL